MTLQEHYNAIKSGKGNKAQFLKQAKHLFPQYLNQYSDFDTATNVLKSKQIISEAAGGVISHGHNVYDWKKILEAKAEEKETSKEVKDALAHAFQPSDMKNVDNINFNEIMKGFFAEMYDEKNKEKTGDEIKAMVVKNLAKDPLYYTKNGNFSTMGIGYTDEAPGLGKNTQPTSKNASVLGGRDEVNSESDIVKNSLVGSAKKNVQDTLGNKEAKTSDPKKVKEMPVAPQNASGVKKMATPGAEKRIKLKEGIQDRADAINDFAKLVKTGTNDEIANTFEANRDYPETSNIKVSEMVKILKKYGKHDDVMALIDDEFIDPVGGRGLSSHMEEAHQMMNIGSVSGGEGKKIYIPKELPFSPKLRKKFGEHIVFNSANGTLYISQILFNNLTKGGSSQPDLKRNIMDIPQPIKQILNKSENYGPVVKLPKEYKTYLPLKAKVEKATEDKFNKAGTEQYWAAGDLLIPNLNVQENSIMEEQKLRSIIRSIINEELNEYGMDSGGQDMTWGMYNRSTSKKDQGNKDFIEKGYNDYYDDIPFNTPAYEFGKNKYYGGADLAKLWQLGWKKAEAEDKGIEFVEDEPNVEDWNDQTGDYDEANLNETK